jgi:hypothetical protein
MSLTGGKRKANKGLKAWVTFVKKVQKEEKLSYKDAIHRAKQRKDKGEKWMKGGVGTDENEDSTPSPSSSSEENEENEDLMMEGSMMTEGGRRRRRTMRKSRKSKKSRKSRKSRSRSSRRR